MILPLPCFISCRRTHGSMSNMLVPWLFWQTVTHLPWPPGRTHSHESTASLTGWPAESHDFVVDAAVVLLFPPHFKPSKWAFACFFSAFLLCLLLFISGVFVMVSFSSVSRKMQLQMQLQGPRESMGQFICLQFMTPHHQARGTVARHRTIQSWPLIPRLYQNPEKSLCIKKRKTEEVWQLCIKSHFCSCKHFS